VESDEVLVISNRSARGQSPIKKYMNVEKVPQLFVAFGGTKFGDPKHCPSTMGWQPTTRERARVHAKYIPDHYPNSKFAVLWQNDDAGRDQLKGLIDRLGNKANLIIADETLNDPSIDSPIVALHASGANTLVSWVEPQGSAQAIEMSTAVAPPDSRPLARRT
jgi:hypothetical protein